jgi:hypothetical protein
MLPKKQTRKRRIKEAIKFLLVSSKKKNNALLIHFEKDKFYAK